MRHIQKSLAVLLLALSLAHSILPADATVPESEPPLPPQPFPALGPGQISCSAYTRHLQLAGIDRERDKAWIVGFVTGYNYFQSVPKYKALFQDYDSGNIIRWVDGQCYKKPDARLVDELHNLIRSLRKMPATK